MYLKFKKNRSSKVFFLSLSNVNYQAAFILVAVLLCSVMLSTRVSAASECGGVYTTILACGNQNAVWSILEMVINILAAGIGIVAIGGIVYGSLMYSSAADNAGQVSQARAVIRNVIIGLGVFALMYPAVQFIIPGGIFGKELASISSSAGPGGKDAPKGNVGGTPADKALVAKPTVFKFATYNVLGFDHNTSASRYGNEERMRRAGALLRSQLVEVAVINEINVTAQRSLLLSSLAGDWKATGLSSGNQDVIIMWDSKKFGLENSGTYNIPVILGKPQRPQPWVKLKHKESKRIVYVYGLHLSLDNGNQREGARQALEHLRQRNASNNSVFIVAGDMNSNDRADPVTYKVFKSSKLLSYSRETAGNLVGNNCDTHHSLGSQDCRATRGSHIDQVWYSNKQKIKVESYAVIANDETAHISDHNPLLVKFNIPAEK